MSESGKTYHFPPGNNRWQSLVASITFLKNPIRTISRNMEKFSGTYSVFLAGRGRLILTEDPDFIQYVLRDNHTNYQKSELSTKTAARLFGNGLLFSNGQIWLKQRRLIQPGFYHNKIQGLYEIIISTAQFWVSRVEKHLEHNDYELTNVIGPDEWHEMLCVETVNAGANTVTLAPAKTHTMTAHITIEGAKA